MAWFLLCFIASIIIIGIYIYEDGRYEGVWVTIKFSFVILFIAGLLSCALYFVIGSLIGSFLPQKDVLVSETPIYAISDTSKSEVSSFIISSRTSEYLVYRYVIGTERGKQVVELKDYENVYIDEYDKNSSETPMLVTYKKDLSVSWHKWFANTISPNDDKVYIFKVPEGTLTNETVIDLK